MNAMNTPLSIYELSQRYFELFDVSATALLRQINPSFDELSQKQAYEFAGREWIKYHVNKGTLKPFRKGMGKNSKILFSRLEIQTLKMAENDISKLIKA